MANVYLQDTTLTAIGDAIRAKAGNEDKLLPSEMANAITNLPSGGGGTGSSVDDIVVRGVFTAADSSKYVTGNVTATEKNVLPLEALGLAGFDNFMSKACYLGWEMPAPSGTNLTFNSKQRLMVTPWYGTVDRKYLFLFHAWATASTSNSTNQLFIYTVSQAPMIVVDLETGIMYDINKYTSGGRGQYSNVDIYTASKTTRVLLNAGTSISYKKIN